MEVEPSAADSIPPEIEEEDMSEDEAELETAEEGEAAEDEDWLAGLPDDAEVGPTGSGSGLDGS